MSSLPPPENDERLTLDKVVLDYQAAWRQGKQPRVEDYQARLQDLSQGTQRSGLYRLIQVDAQQRRRLGHRVSISDYVHRFDTLDREQLDELLDLPVRPESRAPLLPSRYEPLNVVGRGGLGVVWRVHDKNLGRDLAVKVVRDESLAKSESSKRLEQEAVLTGSLQHPGVPPVVEQGKLLTGSNFFSMKLIEGKTMADLIQECAGETKSNRNRLLEILRQVAHAIAYAHSQGVVHCDLKPHNVMVGRFGEVQVMDWGMARRSAADDAAEERWEGASHDSEKEVMGRWLAGQDDSERTGELIGSPSYMAPEQALRRTKEIGPWTDVYALSAILYEVVSGRPPAQGDSIAETLRQVREQTPTPLREIQPNAPGDLATICEKGLARRPQDRYESAIAFDDDLERFLQGRPILARPSRLPERAWKWVKRRPALAALIVVTAFAFIGSIALGVGAVFYQQLQQAHDETIEEKLRADGLLQLARRSRAETDQQKQRAEAAEQVARQLLYAADIDLAQRAWRDFDVGEALALLDKYDDERFDPRGFEWRYLRRLCNTAKLEIPCSDALCAEFAPDLQHLLVGRREHRLAMYDRTTGALQRELDFVGVGEIDVNPDRQSIALLMAQQLVVCSLPDFSPQFEKPSRLLTWGRPNVAYSPGGRWLGYVDQRVLRVVDSQTGEEQAAIPVVLDGRPAIGFAMLAESVLLASFTEIRELDLKGQPVGDAWKIPNGIRSGPVSDSRGVQLSFMTGQDTVEIWDIASRRKLAVRKAKNRFRGPSLPIAIRDVGDRFAFADGAAIRVCHSAGDDLTIILRGSRRDVASIALSERVGAELVSTSEDGVVRLWTVQRADRTSEVLDRQHRYSPQDFSDDGDRLLLIRGNGDAVDIWNLHDGEVEATIDQPAVGAPGSFYLARFRRDQNQLLLARNNGEIVVATRNGETLHVVSGATKHAAIQLASAEKLFAASNTLGVVTVWNNDAKQVTSFQSERQSALAFSHDGRFLASYREGGGIEIRLTEDWSIVATLESQLKRVTQMLFSADDKTLIAGGFSLEMWDVATKTRRVFAPRQERHENRLVRFKINPAGDRLFASLNNGQCRVFDLQSGRRLLTLTGHLSSVIRCLDLQSDGMLRTCSDGGYLRTWDGRPLP